MTATATPRVTILRGTVPTYTARVSHVARNCGDIVLVDVRDLNGRLIRATGGALCPQGAAAHAVAAHSARPPRARFCLRRACRRGP